MHRRLVVDYDEQWPAWFERVAEYVKPFLNEIPVSIEHVGSTAIPGMAAKPIIDMIVVIKKEYFDEVRRRLAKAGYTHQGDLGIVGRDAFDLIDPEVKIKLPTHYLYVCAEESEELKKQRLFRDFLKRNKEYREGLSRLKHELDQKYEGDRKLYMAGKAEMVGNISTLAGEREKAQ